MLRYCVLTLRCRVLGLPRDSVGANLVPIHTNDEVSRAR